MTVGSSSTIPRPLAETNVLAVPRSMARSLARPTPPASGIVIRRERLQLAGELLDPRLHRLRLPVPQPQHERPQHRDGHGDAEVQQVAHGAALAWSTGATGRTSWAHVPQPSPSAQVSR